MCEQCLADATLVAAEVVVGYSVYQAHTSTKHWSYRYYGLVHSNDPVFFIPPDICADPTVNMSDTDVNALSDEDPLWVKSQEHFEYLERAKKFMMMPLNESWRLVQACIKSGYDPESDGHVESWLVNRIASRLTDGVADGQEDRS